MLIFGSQTGRLEKRFEGLWKHVVTRPPACRPQFEAAVESTSWRLQQPLDAIHRRSLQRQNVITRPEGDVGASRAQIPKQREVIWVARIAHDNAVTCHTAGRKRLGKDHTPSRRVASASNRGPEEVRSRRAGPRGASPRTTPRSSRPRTHQTVRRRGARTRSHPKSAAPKARR